ncbi:MAG: LysM peptidoglycan-binding domain-containing protein, partial [Chloroflexi bacterium]|nr:LysM peptidoglycan-binding domain-containing protein [Chloroflexota bacterium]
EERSQFFLDGNFTFKLFKPWAPLYSALSQDVNGLQVGANYEFIANVFVDVVDHYGAGAKVPPSNESEGVIVRTGASPVGAEWRNESQINYSPSWSAGNTSPFHQTYLSLHQTFTATAPQMTVWVEVISKFGYVNNGFFMDRFELFNTSNPTGARVTTVSGSPASVPVAATPVASPTPISTAPSPTATPAVTSADATTTAANPTATVAPTSTAPPTATPAPIKYVVKRGDTLRGIALKFGTTVSALVAVNHIADPSRIFVGRTLIIPGSASSSPGATAPPAPPSAPTATRSSQTSYAVQPGDSLGAIAQKFGITTSLLAGANGISNADRIFVGQVLTIPRAPRTYTVQAGDTLGVIAVRFGTTVSALRIANNLTNANIIFAGQVLTIP